MTVKRGSILIAEPFMEDTNFKRSVVLMCDVHNKGTVGFILNRATPLPFTDLIEGFDEFNPVVFMGGPVQQDTLHYIHTKGDLIPDSKQVTGDIYWGGDFETVKILINQNLLTEDSIKFFIGYSGWDKEQLEQEIDDKSWVITNNINPDLIMHKNPDNVWRESLLEMGGDFALMANFPENPMLN